MVHSKLSVKPAMAVAATMESSVSTPPVNDDVSDNLSDPDTGYKIDLQSLLAKKEKSLKDLQNKHATLMFNLNIECHKSKALEFDQVAFKASFKLTANQEAARLNLTLSSLKESVKCTENSKQDLLK
jgi:hypothetical protein